MPREKKDVEAGLKNKGFQEAQGDHRYFTYWTMEGKKTAIFTKTSHGSRPRSLDDSLLGQMARQVHLSKSQFLDLIDCPLTRDNYEQCLAQKQLL